MRDLVRMHIFGLFVVIDHAAIQTDLGTGVSKGFIFLKTSKQVNELSSRHSDFVLRIT